MKILITGITGLLGSQVAKTCWEYGHSIVGIHRRKKYPSLGFPVEMRRQDMLKEYWDPEIFKEIDVVIHCAADTTMGEGPNGEQDRMNIGTVRRLVQFAVYSNLRQFILISSANTLVPGTSDLPGDESKILDNDPSLLNYANSKISAEKIVREAINEFGLNANIINPTFMIGPAPAGSSSNELIRYALTGRFLFYPDGSKNIVDVRDVAEVVNKCIETGMSGENFLVSNQNLSYRLLFSTIKSLYNKRAVLIHIPNWILWIAGWFGSFYTKLTHKPLELNLTTSRILNSHFYYSNKKIVDGMGITLRQFQTSIRDYIDESKWTLD